MEVIVDGVLYGNANYGSSRQDVCDALGSYPGCPNVGWTFYFDTAQIPDGVHHMNIRMTAADSSQSFAGVAFVVDNANSGVDAPSYYKIVNRQSGKVLDVANNRWQAGTALQQYSFLNGPNQLWQIVPTGDGFFEFSALHSSKALTTDAPYSDGAQVLQQYFSNWTGQHWQLIYQGSGFYAILNRHTGKVLDVSESSGADGASIIINSPAGNYSQQWQLVPVVDSSLPDGPLGALGFHGSSAYSDIDPGDIVAPGISFAAPTQETQTCLEDSRLLTSTPTQKEPSSNGFTYFFYSYTDKSGYLLLRPRP